MDAHYETQGDKHGDSYLHIVSDLFPETLAQLISRTKRLQKNNYLQDYEPIPLVAIKMYAWQLLRAIGHTHQKGILHRDVKPQNILVDHKALETRLCDFGSAKKIDPSAASVSYICSRYYRAPELIFGATKYGDKIDVWSAGCVIAELFKLSPLFPGKNSKE